ncbi:tetratricopeptide repeat protein [Streptomyces sp. RFCAC02]|uniref:tetratricopeptide repeat protein n=1 Tax=Streptomyces sp. RFCAC02 TaxID=2499143 RepID=UPI001F107CA7|nr:tetratricopeptide repeat protein [Streptomyces sp. RFCAC02]
MITSEEDWERRVRRLWEASGSLDGPAFRAAMKDLVALRPPDDPAALFELASALDATACDSEAAHLYRRALAAGLAGVRRRRAVLQLAGTLRRLGRAEESVGLLRAERALVSDDLDDALVAFLALSLTEAGQEREAVSLLLKTLSPHLPRYTEAIARSADELPL